MKDRNRLLSSIVSLGLLAAGEISNVRAQRELLNSNPTIVEGIAGCSDYQGKPYPVCLSSSSDGAFDLMVLGGWDINPIYDVLKLIPSEVQARFIRQRGAVDAGIRFVCLDPLNDPNKRYRLALGRDPGESSPDYTLQEGQCRQLEPDLQQPGWLSAELLRESRLFLPRLN